MFHQAKGMTTVRTGLVYSGSLSCGCTPKWFGTQVWRNHSVVIEHRLIPSFDKPFNVMVVTMIGLWATAQPPTHLAHAIAAQNQQDTNATARAKSHPKEVDSWPYQICVFTSFGA